MLDVLTAPSTREFVERLVLLKRQQDKGQRGALSFCRVHMSSAALSNPTPAAAQQAGETAGGLCPPPPFLIKTAAASFLFLSPSLSSWLAERMENNPGVVLMSSRWATFQLLVLLFHLMRPSTPKTRSLAEKRR